jgi:hypothetical protein
MTDISASLPAINGKIPYKKFVIALKLHEGTSVSRFPAATIRGGFGITLRKLVCPTIDIQCSVCLLRHSCVYCYLFETTPQPDSPRLKQYKALPHPFTLWCNQDGADLTVELVLIGKAIQSLPYFIYTLRKLGTQGLGQQRLLYTLATVTTDNTVLYTDGRDDVNMKFTTDEIAFNPGADKQGTCLLDIYTPMLLRKEGRIVNGYDNYAFFTTLLRRITSLYAIHCEGANFDDCKPLLNRWLEEIKAEASMTLIKNNRFSTRQQQQIDYDGFTGKIALTGNIGTFLPFLKAGELLSVGKNTAFGFGRFRVGELTMVGD